MTCLSPTARSRLTQLRSAVGVILSALASGMAIGWSSPAIPKLMREDPDPFPARWTAPWIVSFFDIGILVGSLVGGLTFSRMGRRVTMALPPTCFLVSGILTVAAPSPEYLLAARPLAGLGMAVILMYSAIYDAEIASPEMRGVLSLTSLWFTLMGTLIQFWAGAYVSFRVQSAFLIPAPVLALVAIVFWMEESPYYLAAASRPDDLLAVLMRLRAKAHPDEVREEAKTIQAAVSEQLRVMSWREIFSTRGGRRAATIALVISSCSVLFGSASVTTYAQTIFQTAGSAIDDEVSSILLICVKMVGLPISGYLLERVGRRPMLIWSLAVNASSLFGLAVYLFLQEVVGTDLGSLNWLPLFFLFSFMLSSSIGTTPVPSIIRGELLDQQGKRTIAPANSIIVSVSGFVINGSFLPLAESAGMFATFSLFAACNAAVGVFAFITVPETKGKTLPEVQDMLHGRTRKDRI